MSQAPEDVYSKGRIMPAIPILAQQMMLNIAWYCSVVLNGVQSSVSAVFSSPPGACVQEDCSREAAQPEDLLRQVQPT